MKENSESDMARLEVMIKVWGSYESSTNKEYGEVILRTVNILIKLTNSLHGDKINLIPWKTWSEPIIFKLCYHASSIIKLNSGTELPFKKNGETLIIFDEPSVFILFRTLLENYLTFFYLFIDQVAEEEKQFRMLVWRYCGLRQRTEFVINTEKERAKQQSEESTVLNLKNEIQSNLYFDKYSNKLKDVILKGRKPRLFESWKSLIVKSNFNTDSFQNIYGYKSNYSHTEFISVLQLREGQYGHHKKNTRSHYLMLLLHGIIAKTIIDLKNYFPSIEEHFEKMNIDIKSEIICLSELSSNQIKVSSV